MLSDTQLKEKLKHWFGFNDFRPGQKKVIQSLLNAKDTLAVLPTGTGKTLIYQYFGKTNNKMVLIVSPLISLMQDQVDRMRYLGEKNTIALTSSLNWMEKRQVINSLSSYKYVYVSPEMLSNVDVLNALRKCSIGLMVIDEAHCINQWGPDFRPEYLNLKNIISKLGHPLMLLLTATASNRVIDDIKDKLALPQVHTIKYSTNRPNILLSVEKFMDMTDKNERLLSLVEKLTKPGIIYFSSKKVADATQEWLSSKTNFRIEVYHADLDTDTRYRIQHQFMDDQIDIICATSAFGMGIDKNNIRFVIHYHVPSNLESYVQEMGRAGRDGEKSVSIILYKENDEILQRNFVDETIPTDQMIDFFYKHAKQLKNNQMDEKSELIDYYLENGYSATDTINLFSERKISQFRALRAMIGYVKTDDCRRKYLLKYFNEDYNNHNENCCDGLNTQLNLQDNGLLKGINPYKNHKNNKKWQDIVKTLFYNN